MAATTTFPPHAFCTTAHWVDSRSVQSWDMHVRLLWPRAVRRPVANGYVWEVDGRIVAEDRIVRTWDPVDGVLWIRKGWVEEPKSPPAGDPAVNSHRNRFAPAPLLLPKGTEP